MRIYKIKLNFLIIKNKYFIFSYIGQKMTKAEIYSKILEVSEKSYYRWKSKDHPILINLIEKYFSDDDLKEFLKTKRIKRFEEISDLELLNRTIIEIYNNFVSSLYKKRASLLKLFLLVLHKSVVINSDIYNNFIELIFDSESEKEDKVELLKEFQKIQDTTLFFYSIKYMIKNEFKYINYSYYDIGYLQSCYEEINFKIYNIELYLGIFLKKEYTTFNEYIKNKNIFEDDEESESSDLNELNLLENYYEYLYSLVSKEKNNENKVKINTRTEIEYLLPEELI